MATTTSEGSESDRTSEAQEQTRTGTQEQVSAPGTRTQTERNGGQRTIARQPVGMEVSFVIERVNPLA